MNLLERWTGLYAESPWWGALGLLPPLLVAAVAARHRHRRRAAAFAPAPLLEAGAPFPRTWRARLLGLPALLHGLGLLLAAVALAQPVRRVPLPAVRDGIDLLLCLDVSSSMATRDFGGDRSRLDAARAAAVEFAQRRPDDRLGVCAFARFADLLCPPTLDHGALERLLLQLDTVPRESPEDATAIGAAVARCVQALQGAPSPSRVVVLVTDGDENVATAGAPHEIGPLQAAQLAAQQGVRVYALVVATDGVDTRQVEALAQGSGGRLFRAGDAAGMRAVYAEIDRLEQTPFAAPRWRHEPRHAPFALAALLLVLLGWVLRRTALQVLA